MKDEKRSTKIVEDVRAAVVLAAFLGALAGFVHLG